MLFVVAYAVTAGFGLPATAFTLAGGAIFGTALGSLLNWIGATLGALTAYGLARQLGSSAVRNLLGRHARLLESLTGKTGFAALLRLRLIPIVPFNALNFAAGLAPVPFRSYALSTALGIIPGTIRVHVLRRQPARRRDGGTKQGAAARGSRRGPPHRDLVRARDRAAVPTEASGRLTCIHLATERKKECRAGVYHRGGGRCGSRWVASDSIRVAGRPSRHRRPAPQWCLTARRASPDGTRPTRTRSSPRTGVRSGANRGRDPRRRGPGDSTSYRFPCRGTIRPHSFRR